MLFSALAAEAYANEFLSRVLMPSDVDALERLQPLDKLLIGPRVAGHEAPLERGRQPAQRLAHLFDVRNKLVHPRPSGVKAYAMDVQEGDRALIGPKVGADSLHAVASAIVLLEPFAPVPHIIGEANLIAANRQVLDDHVALLGDKLLAVPKPDDPPPLDLFEQMRKRAARAPHAST